MLFTGMSLPCPKLFFLLCSYRTREKWKKSLNHFCSPKNPQSILKINLRTVRCNSNKAMFLSLPLRLVWKLSYKDKIKCPYLLNYKIPFCGFFFLLVWIKNIFPYKLIPSLKIKKKYRFPQLNSFFSNKRNYMPKKSSCHVYIHNKFRKEVTSS